MNEETKSFLKRYWVLPLIAIRSLFKGFTEIVWAIAGMFLLIGLVKYYEQEVPQFILETIQIIISKISFFKSLNSSPPRFNVEIISNLRWSIVNSVTFCPP